MPDNKDQMIENLQKEGEELKRIVEMQNDISRDLREQLRKNSSKGGQNGHSGTHLAVLSEPDHESTIFTLTVSVVRSERFA